MSAFISLAVIVLLAGGPGAWAHQDAGSSSGSASQSNDSARNGNAQSSRSAEQKQSPSEGATGSSAEEKPASQKPSSAKRTHVARKQPSTERKTQPPVEDEPRKVVVRRGGVREPVAQIIPGMTAEEARHQRQESEDLLAAADLDLRILTDRDLNSTQQQTISQIRHYMEVARSALKDGDIQRAHTLAQKAQLLADDLVKHEQ